MTETQSQLIRILAVQLFGGSIGADHIDWADLLSEAQMQAVFPLVFSYAETASLPEDLARRYGDLNGIYLVSGVRNLYCHNELHKLLSAHDVPYVILKGQASARYYPRPLLRAAGDVDFLVDRDRIREVDSLLAQNGYQKLADAEKHGFHWEYKKQRESFEMHWDVPGLPQQDAEVIKRRLSDILEKRQFVRNTSGEFAVPSDFHHGLVLLLHMIGHMTSTGIGLRHLCDWLVFENSLPEASFVRSFEKPLKEIGLWTFAQVLSRIGVLYFGCEDKAWCREADDAVCAAFLEDVFAGGNFGRKDDSRKGQEKLIRNNVTRKVDGGGIVRNALVNIDDKAKKEYPFMKENPILLPVGWSLVCAQYLFRVASGKRHNVFSKAALSGVMDRKRLYSELKLFEPDGDPPNTEANEKKLVEQAFADEPNEPS